MTPQPSPHEGPLPTDTAPAAAEVQARLVREMGPGGRVEACFRLSESVVLLARRSLENRMPGASKRDIDRAFIESCYGAELARGWAAHFGVR